MNKTAITIITYNVPNLISRQVECIRRFCKDEHDIIVFDNSSNNDMAESIAYYCTQMDVPLVKIYSAESSGSKSNAFACNFAYQKIKDSYDFIMFLDHDTFPLRDFSIQKIIEGRMMAGVGQEKGVMYFQQTSLMWDNRTIDKSLVDFSPCEKMGLDTGGLLYRVIEKYGKDACVFFNEKYYQNPYFREGFYNFYATVNDDMFMHFINASGWNPIVGNDTRLNALLNVLNERINGKT